MGRYLVLLGLLLGLSHADAQSVTAKVVASCGIAQGTVAGNYGTFTIDVNGVLCTTAGSGGGSGGTANAATTSNGTDGQAASSTNQQNVVYPYGFNGSTWDRTRSTGGAWWSAVGQYNSTLPTLASGAYGPLATDVNGRLLLAPNQPVNAQVVIGGGYATSGTGASNAQTQRVVTSTDSTVGVTSLPSLPAGTNTIGSVNQAGAPWAVNETQVGGVALTAPTAYGTAPTGNVPAVNANVTASALPTGAAVASSQVRGVSYSVAYKMSIAANGFSPATGQAVPSPNLYSKFNAFLYSTTAGTYSVEGSNDNFATAGFTLGSGSITAGAPGITVSSAILFTSYRAYITNGSTAGVVTVVTSFTAS